MKLKSVEIIGLHFIAHTGTDAVENLFFRKYTKVSEEISQKQDKLNKQIVDKISQSDDNSGTLREIKQQIEKLQKERALKMKPFISLKKSLQKFFKDKSVNIGDIEALSFSSPKQGINCSSLSAGEKQMLGFFVYNAFYQDTIFIIDEAKTNLHGDWQRILVPALKAQNSTNQFILATHSPFIYGKFPHKEAPLIPFIYGKNPDNESPLIADRVYNG